MGEFRLFGDLQFRVGGLPVDLGPRKQRTVLAALLMEGGRVVPIEALIDRVWGDSPPGDARSVLYTYATRIRRILAAAEVGVDPPVTLTHRHGGYTLDVAADAVDAHLMRRLVDRARELDRTDPQRIDLLRQAVAQWHGEPLAGLPGEWASRVRDGLDRQVCGTLAIWAATELELGRPEPVIDLLGRALSHYPLAEPLILHLVRALHLAGRRAEALEQYARSRRDIRTGLGVEPGPELRDLHLAILRAPEPQAEPAPPAEPVEIDDPGCRLPADLPDHTGCELEISQALTALGATAPPEARRPLVILTGASGIGKTSLSIRLAHLLREDYPDGQIFVSAGGRDTSPGEILGRVLGALGVPDSDAARSIEDKLARYRTAISGRRILIVLDDIAGAQTIRPLIPGSPGTALIVSTRAALTTIPGAEHIELRRLAPAESLRLLSRIVGDPRVDSEPDAAASLVEMCGGLPLALRITGARLAARPHWPVARLTQRMSDERRRLDEMAADGLAVRMSIAVSHDGLTPPARRLFRLLGFMAAVEFSDWLAEALLGAPAGAGNGADDLLEQLIDARLVEIVAHRNGIMVYRMHDLVRLYAHERAVAEDPDEELRAAVDRVVDAAIDLVERHGQRLPYAVPRRYRRSAILAGAPPADLSRAEYRPGFVQAERACLVSVVERATALGMDESACVLADALVFASFAVNNDFEEWNRAHAAAQRAARANGNRAGEAIIECGIGFLRYKEDRFDAAERHFASAIALFETADDVLGAATARCGLGTVLREVGRHREGVPMLEQALVTLDEVGERDGAAHAAYGLGYAHRELGNDEKALHYLDLATSIYQGLGHWRGEVIAVRGIGLVHRARGDLRSAAEWCGRAHDLVLAHGDRHLACYTAQSLAKVWIRQGATERAREPLRQAVAVCRELNDRLGLALTLRTVGELHLMDGLTGPALRDLGAARAVWTELAHALGVARTLRDIGAAHALAGDCDAAHAAWRTAWRTFTDLGTREAGELSEWRRRWGCTCADAALSTL